MLIGSLRELWNDLERLDKQIADIERRLQTWMKEDKTCHAIAAIRGLGFANRHSGGFDHGRSKSVQVRRRVRRLGRPDSRTNRHGRKGSVVGHLQAWRHVYIRTLLIHGAPSVLFHAKELGLRLEQMRKRRPPNVITVALANKMARTIWAILVHGTIRIARAAVG
jgi:transposase